MATTANTPNTPPARDTLHVPPPAGVALAGAALDTDDPRARAVKRAAELLEHGVMEEGTDEFYIDPAIIPEGWSYEYKMHTVLGKEDFSYQVQLAQMGWEAVPASRHPKLMPGDYKGNTILRKGMMLMERPAEITERIKQNEYRKAREQVTQKEQQLNGTAPGTFERVDARGRPTARVGRSYEPMAIPKT